MAEILITSGLAFAGTNMDDILILMILFAAAGSRKERLCITAGQYLGMGLLTQMCIRDRGLRLTTIYIWLDLICKEVT